MNQEKFIKYLSWVATGMSVMMYVSYLPQIANNLSGMKGNPIQPLVAAINCTPVSYTHLTLPTKA